MLDFDGTLTKPAFDWPTMKKEMKLPDENVSILDHLVSLSPERVRETSSILEKYEREAANNAEANEGAHELIARTCESKKFPLRS